MTRTTEVIQWAVALYLLGEVLGWTVVKAVRAKKVNRDPRS